MSRDVKVYRKKDAFVRLNMTKEMFAERIRTYRFNHRLSQEEMSYVVGGISARTIARWESGKFWPNSKVVINKLLTEGVLP